ncbi:MAG: hypothetical protein Q9181_006479 [Wetmoreana brouardii]
MADQLSLAVNIIDVVKHTYHVAQFVYKALRSAQTEDVERQKIASDLGRELNFLASFQRYFEKAQGAVAYDQKLDQIEQVVRHLKQDFSDYEKLARKDAPNLPNSSATPLPLLLRPSEENQPGKPKPPIDKSSSMTQKLKDGQIRVYTATRWALFDRQRLQKVVEKFTKRNKTLKEILQFAMAGMLQQFAQHDPGLKDLQQDQDAATLGLTTWAEIKQIRDQPEDIDKSFSIDNCTIKATGDASGLRLSHIYIKLNKTNALGENKLTKEAVLAEYKTYPLTPQGLSGFEVADFEARTEQHVDQLAKLLSTAGSNSLGTLPFRGYVKEDKKNRYALLFNIPEAMTEANPDSLHEMIEGPALGRLWSLSVRFEVALKLAKIMGTFHMFEWVFKGLQSRSIVFCVSAVTNIPQLSKPYLAGFEYIRPVSGSTVGQPLAMSEEDALYCHPDLQEEPDIAFGKIHDLYSLGVVLLEIGLWTTASQLIHQLRPPRPSKLSQIRDEYIKKAKSKLPLRMGISYTEVVVACLESKYKHEAIRPDVFLKVFDEEIVQNLSAKRLLE